MNELRILSPTAILGYGFPEASFRRGLAARPDVLAVDAGSTDPGPAYLGLGQGFVDPGAVRRDLGLLIAAGLERRIPVIVGTAGGCGARPHVNATLEIVDDLLRGLRRRARVAVIYSDVPRAQVRRRLREGRIAPLPFVPPLTEEALAATPRIVAQIGVEPLVAALGDAPDILIAGRCYDPAVFAALPVARGFDRGLALHLGKILECAAIAATPGSGRDCVLGILRRDRFELRPLSSARKFTCASVAAHTFYEKSHPFRLPGPGGVSDLSACRFRHLTPNAVEVRGSRFLPDSVYRIKIEGARRVGYRTIAICGIRDPILLSRLDTLLDGVRAAVADNFPRRRGRLAFRVYGRDGVMGEREPRRRLEGHEACLILDAVAPTQAEADTLCGFARSTALHYGYPGRVATAGNLAFPFSPSDLHAGPVFDFSVYHLMELDDPVRPFPCERLTLGGRA